MRSVVVLATARLGSMADERSKAIARTFHDLNWLLIRSAPWIMLVILALEAVPTMISGIVLLLAHVPSMTGSETSPAAAASEAAHPQSHTLIIVFSLQLVLTFVTTAANTFLALKVRDKIAIEYLSAFEAWRKSKPFILTRPVQAASIVQGGGGARYLNRYLNGVSRGFYSIFLFVAALAGLMHREALPVWLLVTFVLFALLGIYATLAAVGVTSSLMATTRTYMRSLRNYVRDETFGGPALEELKSFQADLRMASLKRIVFGTAISAVVVAAGAIFAIVTKVGHDPLSMVALLALLVSLSWLVHALANSFAVLPLLDPLMAGFRIFQGSKAQLVPRQRHADCDILCRPEGASNDLRSTHATLLTDMAARPVAVRLASGEGALATPNFFCHLAWMTGSTLWVTERPVGERALKSSDETVEAGRSWDVYAQGPQDGDEERCLCFVETAIQPDAANAIGVEFFCDCNGTRLVIERYVAQQWEQIADIDFSEAARAPAASDVLEEV